MKVLLLQARNPNDDALEHEQLAFRETLGLDEVGLCVWDLLGGPPPFDKVASCDCVMVGGAGEFGIADTASQPWLARFIDFCGELAARQVPTFASCFGFQALVAAAGGRVETDTARAQLGTFEVTLTEAGRRDPLFGPLGPRFGAQFGHKDHALEMPSGLVNLASSPRSPFQALAVEGAPIYATQFHPELSMEHNRQRFDCYREAYSRTPLADTPEQVLASFRETPKASSLLRRYVTGLKPQ